MLKHYALIVSLVLFAGAPSYYFYYQMPIEQKLSKVEVELSHASETLSSAKAEAKSASAEVEEAMKAKEEIQAQLSKKEEEIKVLEEDFKKLFAEQDSFSTLDSESTCDCPTCSQKAAAPVSIKDKIEQEAIDLFYARGLWKMQLPYLQWAEVPDLENLYSTTTNERLKNTIENDCPTEYYSETEESKLKEEEIKTLIKGYCKLNKRENCPAEIEEKIQAIESDNWVKASYWIQMLTIYSEESPSDYTQRGLVYFNEYWETICAWKATKNNKWEEYFYKIR